MSLQPVPSFLVVWRCRLERLRGPFSFAMTLFFLSLCASANAQTQPNVYDLKAAFIFHFAQLVDWPKETSPAADSSVLFCVDGESAYLTALATVMHGKQIGGQAIEIRDITQAQDLHPCRVLFIGGNEQRHTSGVLARAKDLPILTVGETEDFVRRGGIIGLCIEENKVRFDINLVAAHQVNLRISSRLLLLARNVIGGKAG